MNEWRDLTLDQLGRIVTGKTPPTADRENYGGEIPFVTPTDMDGRRIISKTGRYLTKRGLRSVANAEIPSGSVMVSCIGSDMGKAAIAGSSCVTNQQINSIVVNDEHDSSFIYYNLSVRKTEIRTAASGSAQPIMNKSTFGRLRIAAPDKTKQTAIASVLGALDQKIELNRRMNETLEFAARAIFRDWLVDFGPTRAKLEGRAPYLPADIWSLFPDRLDDDGKPEGWRIIQLGQLLDVLETGGRPKGGVSSYFTGVPSVGAESITGLGKFDFSKTKFVPENFFNSMNKGHVQSRDVLLYKDGGKPGLFEPHVTLFGDGFPFSKFAINEHVYRMRAVESYGQNCLYFWLSTESVEAEMRIKGTGVAIPGLNSTQVKSLSVVVPNGEIAKQLNLALEPFVTRVLANCNESKTLAATRDFLLPKLMSGEVRVKDAEKLVGEAI